MAISRRVRVTLYRRNAYLHNTGLQSISIFHDSFAAQKKKIILKNNCVKFMHWFSFVLGSILFVHTFLPYHFNHLFVIQLILGD